MSGISGGSSVSKPFDIIMGKAYNSSVLEMGGLEGGPGDAFGSQEVTEPSQPESSFDNENPLYKTMQNTMKSAVWEAGKQQATKAWNFYGNIDILRPYFDVEPGEVFLRLLGSLKPEIPRPDNPIKVPRELYGPSMLVLTLVAILLFQMKLGGHTVQEGTLMGTAFATCFGYWLGVSCCLWLSGFLSNTHLSFIQVLNLVGYGMVSHCVVVLIGTVVHTEHDHLLFYGLLGVFGGLSALRIVSIIFSRTHSSSQKLFLSAIAVACHIMFFIYLHFAYHNIVTELSKVFPDAQVTPNQI